ncbi:MAG: nucleotide exchange factor GrpE [Ignavibacteriales bacterium]|nr:nucleotide exchange factor GrpE [Ignavibacteriales bacterium]
MKEKPKEKPDEKKKSLNEEVENPESKEKKEIEVEKIVETIEEKIVKELTEETEKLKSEKEELKNLLLRKAAEFENYKRRSESEFAQIIKYAAEPILVKILSVYDDFERSISHIDDENNFNSTKEGLKLLFEKFSKTLNDLSIKKINSKGMQFDVNLHDALLQQVDDSVQPNTILEEVEAGYMYKDKVIRHSKVIVSRQSEEPVVPENEKENISKENENNEV